MPRLGSWEYTVDANRTRAAYASEAKGKADSCDCFDCRNFRLVRDTVFAGHAEQLLSSLGIDHRKEGENYRLVETAPGLHHYEGWFHFVGELQVAGDFPPIQVTDRVAMFMCKAYAPPLKSLTGLPLIQLEFIAKGVPWAIDEYVPPY